MNKEVNKVLTDLEIQTLKSMSLYWEEVRKRDDTSPLYHEIAQIHRMLGTKILFVIEHYIELLETEE